MCRPLSLSSVVSISLLASAWSGAAGCGAVQSQPSWLDTPLEAFPATLSAVGLYEDPSDPSRVSERALAYAPEFALWSNGSAKRRFLVLPKGATIDPTDEPWSFPEGTVLIKTFSFENANGVAQPVETRLLRAKGDGWDYAAYLWKSDRSDATLLDGRSPTKVSVNSDGERFQHEVPSQRQCRECHESGPSFVLGFNAWQLDYKQQRANETLLDQLAGKGAFSSKPHGAAIEDDEPETRWIKGYVAANCTHCHNGGDSANAAFDLQPDDFIENTVGHETESSASGNGIRIVAGEPENSVLYLGFVAQDNGTGIKAMPPLGVQRRDGAAADRLEDWIEAL